MTKPFKWEGADAFVAGLRRVPRELRRVRVREALLYAVEPMVDAMAAAAHRSPHRGHGWNTGRHLADGIGARIADAGNSAVVRVEVGPMSPAPPYEFWYDTFVEFGTSKLKGQPFARPGWDATKDLAMQRLAEFVQGAYARAMRSAA